MNATTTNITTTAGKGWTIGLWIAQILLAAMFGMAGFNKLTLTPDALVAMGMGWVSSSPIALVRFIGIAEIAGTLGILLPAATRIMPKLTPLAAIGFAVIQVLAMGVHTVRGEFMVLPINLVLLALAVLVVWGRNNKAPIAPRA